MSLEARSRWLLAILALSLALNIGSGAFLLGRALMPRGADGPAGVEGWHGRHMERFAEQVPGEAGRIVHEQMMQGRGDFLRTREAVGRAREAANAALTAEPFDAKAYADALTELRRQGEVTQAILHHSVVEAAGKLDRQGRQQLAEWHRKRRGPPPR